MRKLLPEASLLTVKEYGGEIRDVIEVEMGKRLGEGGTD